MNSNLKQIFFNKTFLLIGILVFILLVEMNAAIVENVYYKNVYQFTSNIQRFIASIFPFSLGDIFYLALLIYCVYKLFAFIKNLISSSSKKDFLKKSFLKAINFLLIIAIMFKVVWGINYSRKGVAQQFTLTKKEYAKKDLETFYYDLIFDANYCRKNIADTNLPTIKIDSVFTETKNCYNKISKYYPFLKVNNFNIKKSLYSSLGSYLGYTGYYNPFSGEAQVRSDLPTILLPIISCHEVAHQLGYASEEEANFIGFLVCNESENLLFRYSFDLDLIDYVQEELVKMYLQENDIKTLVHFIYQKRDCMSEQVRKDRKAIRDFFNNDRKKVADISNYAFDKYLKINHQNKGIKSYNEVVAWLMEYRNKMEK